MQLGDKTSYNKINCRSSKKYKNTVHMIETINKIVRTQRQIMSEFGRGN